MTQRPAWEKHLWLGGLAASSVAVVFLLTPLSAYLPPCLLYYLLGVYCPGCGSGRMLTALLNGHWAEALSANPLLFVCLPVFAALFVYAFGVSVLNRPWKPLRLPHKAGWVILGILIAYGVLRNIPSYPFTLLAPFARAASGFILTAFNAINFV